MKNILFFVRVSFFLFIRILFKVEKLMLRFFGEYKCNYVDSLNFLGNFRGY